MYPCILALLQNCYRKKQTNKKKKTGEIIHIGTKRGVGLHLLVARFHSNLSLLTPVCEVVVSGTDIVVLSCCPEYQQSPFKGCRGIVQELLEWRVTRLDWVSAATLSVTFVVARTSECHSNVLCCWVRLTPGSPQGVNIIEESWIFPRQRIVCIGIRDFDYIMPVSTWNRMKTKKWNWDRRNGIGTGGMEWGQEEWNKDRRNGTRTVYIKIGGVPIALAKLHESWYRHTYRLFPRPHPQFDHLHQGHHCCGCWNL